jgi:hypothetical protein
MNSESISAIATDRAGRAMIQAIEQAEQPVIAPASGGPCLAATQRCELDERRNNTGMKDIPLVRGDAIAARKEVDL